MIFLAGCLYALFLGLNNGIANYISVYFWQWTPSDISIFPLAGGISAIIGAVILLNEFLNNNQLIGAIIVLGSLSLATYLTNKSRNDFS